MIDEEQRFGVTHKEKIKKMKENVDVLTLTATPIPRTLHMSLVGIRDMSVLEEAPEERQPIQTYVMEYNEEWCVRRSPASCPGMVRCIMYTTASIRLQIWQQGLGKWCRMRMWHLHTGRCRRESWKNHV